MRQILLCPKQSADREVNYFINSRLVDFITKFELVEVKAVIEYLEAKLLNCESFELGLKLVKSYHLVSEEIRLC